jgi:hypothetical protein
VNSGGLELAQDGPQTGKYARACARVAGLAKRPLVNQITGKESKTLFPESLAVSNKPSPFLFLHKVKSTTVDGGAGTPTSLYWPKYAKTGPLTWLTPNSIPNSRFPSINCTVRALNHTVHGDGANQGQFVVFSVT